MSAIKKLAIKLSNPEMCAVCPRRSLFGKFLASKVLGSEYAVSNCEPSEIVHDTELRNRLYKEGLVPKPYGISATPQFMRTIEDSGIGLPVRVSPRGGVGTTIPFDYGFSDAVCPVDVPQDYHGDFAAFRETGEL